MKKRLVALAITVFLLFVALIVYSIFNPYTAWLRRVSHAQLTVDGKLRDGWLHRGNRGKTYFVTYSRGDKFETYEVFLSEGRQGLVWNCGKWTATRFPVFAIGDVNPPCFDFEAAAETKSSPATPSRNLTSGDNFIEFTIDDGSRLKATW